MSNGNEMGEDTLTNSAVECVKKYTERRFESDGYHCEELTHLNE